MTIPLLGDADGTLTIAGVPMRLAGAWAVLDYTPLLAFPESTGENVRLPGVPGRRKFPRTPDDTVYQLPMVLGGAADVDGDPYGDPMTGFLTNRDFLLTEVVTTDGVTASRVAEYTRYDGVEWVADVQVQILLGTVDTDAEADALLIITGLWAEAGS